MGSSQRIHNERVAFIISLAPTNTPPDTEGALLGLRAAADSSGGLAQYLEAGDGNRSACQAEQPE